MEHKLLQSTLLSARQACESSGKKLTEKRQRVLEILLKAEGPMSAYELIDAYNQVTESPIMAMSVYRILDFLESVRLVHRLHSANKYMPCNSSCGSCQHLVSAFLICKSCQKVSEVETSENIVSELLKIAGKKGYSLSETQLELAGVCQNCHSTADLNSN
ncbi:MAG: Fur family transcriptional regulator [Aestuariibacter sp.]